MSGAALTCSAYVVLCAERAHWSPNRITSVKVDRVRVNKPTLAPDEVAVRVTFSIPASVFEDPAFAASIDIDPDLAIKPDAIRVEAIESEVTP